MPHPLTVFADRIRAWWPLLAVVATMLVLAAGRRWA